MHSARSRRLGPGLRPSLSLVGLLLVALLAVGETGPQCGNSRSSPSDWSSVEAWYTTSGGFHGGGTGDVIVEDGRVTVRLPYGEPSSCTVTLREEWGDDLVGAAGGIDWDAVPGSYIPAGQEGACCDLTSSDLTVRLMAADGESRTAATRWQTLSEPDDVVLSLVARLEDLRDAVAAECELRGPLRPPK